MPDAAHILPSTRLRNLAVVLTLWSTAACGPSGLHSMTSPNIKLISHGISVTGEINTVKLELTNDVVPMSDSDCVTNLYSLTARMDGKPMVTDTLGQITHPSSWSLESSAGLSCPKALFHAQLDPAEATTTFTLSDGTDRLVVTCEHLGTPLTATFQDPPDGSNLHPGQNVTLQVTPGRVWGAYPIWLDPIPTTLSRAPAHQWTSGDGTLSFTVPSSLQAASYLMEISGDTPTCTPQGRLHVFATVLQDEPLFLPVTVTTP